MIHREFGLDSLLLPDDIMNVSESQLNQLALFSYLQQLRDYLIQQESINAGKGGFRIYEGPVEFLEGGIHLWDENLRGRVFNLRPKFRGISKFRPNFLLWY